MRKLAEKQKIESTKENERKRKMKENELTDIKRQKLSLERSVKSVEADVDDHLPQAEEKSDISYLVKYNALVKLFGKRKTLLRISTTVCFPCLLFLLRMKYTIKLVGQLWTEIHDPIICTIIWQKLVKTCSKLAI